MSHTAGRNGILIIGSLCECVCVGGVKDYFFFTIVWNMNINSLKLARKKKRRKQLRNVVFDAPVPAESPAPTPRKRTRRLSVTDPQLSPDARCQAPHSPTRRATLVLTLTHPKKKSCLFLHPNAKMESFRFSPFRRECLTTGLWL